MGSLNSVPAKGRPEKQEKGVCGGHSLDSSLETGEVRDTAREVGRGTYQSPENAPATKPRVPECRGRASHC